MALQICLCKRPTKGGGPDRGNWELRTADCGLPTGPDAGNLTELKYAPLTFMLIFFIFFFHFCTSTYDTNDCRKKQANKNVTIKFCIKKRLICIHITAKCMSRCRGRSSSSSSKSGSSSCKTRQKAKQICASLLPF